ncbi:MAG: S1 family peptidase [Salinarimonas sp.]
MPPRSRSRPRLVVPLLALAAAIAAALVNASPADAITRGRAADATDGLREGVVRIESSEGELCTGVLVRDDIVLTAAHCVLEPVGYRIFALDYGFRRIDLGVSASVLHPSFQPGIPPREQPGVDLALLKLDRRLGPDFRAFDVAAARMPGAGDGATIAGFGTTRFRAKSTARTLRFTYVVVMGEARLGNRMVMAADPERLGEQEGAGACQGDSGGPLLSGEPGAYRLDGIISWSSGAFAGARGAACGGLTAITPVAPHVRWITARMRDLDRAAPSAPPAPLDITPNARGAQLGAD